MVASKRRPATLLDDPEEEAERRRMAQEYRQANIKDMNREAMDHW